MQRNEVRNFKMATGGDASDASTEFGKPLYISCFSSLKIRVGEARGLTGTVRQAPDAFAVTEVISQASGVPLDKYGLFVCLFARIRLLTAW